MVAGMQRAVRKAGLGGATKMQRIWQWLKDHPDHLPKEIGAAIGEVAGDVSSCLGQLFDREMVTRKVEPSTTGIRHTPTYRYRTNPKMKEYELWPISAAGKKRHDESLLKRIENKARKEARKTNIFTLAGTAHLPPVAKTEPEIEPAPQPAAPPQLPVGLTSEEYEKMILANMNVEGAYRLYKALRKMFKSPEKAFK